MRLRPTLFALICSGIGFGVLASASFAQTAGTSPSIAPSPVLPPGTSVSTDTGSTTSASAGAMPDQAQMMKMMMEMSKLNENHKLLASTDGTWTFINKMWMNGDSNSKPQESKGTAVRKSIMGGRYVMMDVTGKMQMPGPDGKPREFEFKGQGIDGYDNAKQKFVSAWVDNMGTGIMTSEGTYDPTTKSLTYTGEYQMGPAMKEQFRSVVKLTDKDHMTFEWYENQTGTEKKTMQIDYTRSGKSK